MQDTYGLVPEEDEVGRRMLRLWELVIQLTAWCIPFAPPLKGDSLERLKANNRRGYDCLMEYLELKEQEDNEEG